MNIKSELNISLSNFKKNLISWLKSWIRVNGRALYHSLPMSDKSKLAITFFLYRVAGFIFTGLVHYEVWKRSQSVSPLTLRGSGLISRADISSTLQIINFKLHDSPSVSIVIPTYGNLPATLTCLKSIFQNIPDVSIEIIVQEDFSSDPEIDQLAKNRPVFEESFIL